MKKIKTFSQFRKTHVQLDKALKDAKTENELKYFNGWSSLDLLSIPRTIRWFSLKDSLNICLYCASCSWKIPGNIPSGQINITFSFFGGELIEIKSSMPLIGSIL